MFHEINQIKKTHDYKRYRKCHSQCLQPSEIVQNLGDHLESDIIINSNRVKEMSLRFYFYIKTELKL